MHERPTSGSVFVIDSPVSTSLQRRGYPDESGDIRLSLFFLAHCFYQRTITWSLLFLHRTIIPHKKVLQKGCEQILFLH